MEQKVIMAVDQGTTGTRVILFDHEGNIIANAYREIAQVYPQPGWVEHDPKEYWQTVLECTREVMEKGGLKATEIAAIGITNQRETTILWDKDTGQPLYNAIVWQCRRTAAMCEELKAKGLEPLVRERTGLVIDAYFSATKIRWILDNVPEAKEKLAQGKVCMGNIDSWLIWHLSGAKAHVTDYSNASRTMLLNIHTLSWDEDLLKAIGIPREILPELMPSSGIMARTAKERFFGAEVPVAGVAGDQHAATFGQTCFKPGMAKNTYGTALALMMNIGQIPKLSQNGLTTNLGWHIAGKTEYALEGVVFIGGAAVQWLRDGIGIVDSAQACNELAITVPDTGGVYMVPAFTGLCAPYWDMYARGLIIGITGGTGREHIARASLESMAYQTRDVLDAMVADSGEQAASLKVDGGATQSDFLMQFQADILGIPVERPSVTEMAARGAAYLAGLGVGFWKSKEEIAEQWKLDRTFEPRMGEGQRERLYAGWQNAVERSLGWAR
ncbi:MAG: glycerol kinase GlpK [Spirochaetaceae bacterium]|nr:MAG: glycerol kinase GlpK [Spirochaetaceae bacterium]